MPELISVSDIKQFRECEQYMTYQQIDKRVPIRLTGTGIHVGTLWHLACEAMLKGVPNPRQIAEDQLEAWWRTESTEVIKKIERQWGPLRLAFDHLHFPPDMHIMEVEYELRRDMGSFTFVGRADAVVEWKGVYWHLQHKTLGAGKPIDIFTKQMAVDYHECLYEWILRDHYMPWGGTLLNIVRKLSFSSMAPNPRKALILLPITRPTEIVRRTVEDLTYLGNEVAGARSSKGIRPIRDRNRCTGPNGNFTCPYYDVCYGTSRLDDNTLFTDATPRYS